MTIKHHLDDATLMSLSAGTLGEALSVVASAHIAVCEQCRSRLREMDFIGGALLANAEPKPLASPHTSVGSIVQTHMEMGKLHANAKTQKRFRVQSDLPGPLSWIIEDNLSDIPWKWVAPGIAMHALQLSEGATGDLRLLKVAPDKKLPDHGHSGSELTFILKGAYRDKFGVFGPGDIADMDEDTEHQPIVEPGEDCICIVASEAPAKFKGPIARMLQPLIGI